MAFKPKNSSSFPGPLLRILGLINHFKKEAGITGLAIDDKLNMSDYRILKLLARRVHGEMVEEIYKTLKKEDKPVVLPCWSEVASEVVAKYGFRLEKVASQHGFTLGRCQKSWAAILLLSETHKYKSNRSRNKAAVFSDSRYN